MKNTMSPCVDCIFAIWNRTGDNGKCNYFLTRAPYDAELPSAFYWQKIPKPKGGEIHRIKSKFNTCSFRVETIPF